MGGTLVLDREGLAKLAAGDVRARAHLEAAIARRARVVASAVTLTEVLRGGPRDAAVHRVLSRITVVPASPALGRHAGELLGATGLPGKRCSVDAVVAAAALEGECPVVVLTSDPVDLNRLVEGPGRPKARRITVIHM